MDRMAVTASTRRRAAPIVVLLVLAALPTACGRTPAAPGVASVGSRSTSTSQPVVAAPVTSVPSAAQTAASTEFAACLRKEGLTRFPDPPYSAGELNNLGYTKQVVQEYENGACHKYALAGGWIPTAAENQQHMEQMLAMAKCMRAHGIVGFPDPSSQGGVMMPVSVAEEPGYSAAAKVCQAPPAPAQITPAP
jgi:hypothetical protein